MNVTYIKHEINQADSKHKCFSVVEFTYSIIVLQELP